MDRPGGFTDSSLAPTLLVGIGTSAGGLEPLSTLLAHLGKGSGASFVVLQHQSPKYKSLLPQLIARSTALNVTEVRSGEHPVRDTIYVAPANRNLAFELGAFRLDDDQTAAPHPSINAFFTALALEWGSRAVGVILSGNGEDGARGLRAIKAAGGHALAQTPESAAYPAMPRAAIATDLVDRVLAPERIAEELMRIARMEPAPEEVPTVPEQVLVRILGRLQQRCGIDFSSYKEATLARRIARRMQALKIERMEDYLPVLEGEPGESQRLCQEILISVTAFFRDRPVFDRLDQEIARLLDRVTPGEPLRVWVAGCASGEEAYSVAILLAERLSRIDDGRPRVQVFATDVDTRALDIARRGAYNRAALIDVPAVMQQRYFGFTADQGEAIKSLRDGILFARHDLLRDPPFNRLDLIICRNVLIYFRPEAYERVLRTFHFALKPGGALLLGRSETLHRNSPLFRTEDAASRLFHRREGVGQLPPMSGTHLGETPPPLESAPQPRDDSVYLASAAAAFIPPGLLVERDGSVRHIHGDVSPYMRISSGRPIFDIHHLVRDELRGEVQTLQRRTLTTRQPQSGRVRRLSLGRAALYLRVRTLLVNEPGMPDGLMLVCFEAVNRPARASAQAASDDGAAHRELSDELAATREHLQTVIEELEASNEEMQALNEEVQSANEELQSTNEELEASNEELQSSNEELTTVNEELQNKTVQLESTNRDLENIQNNIAFPLFVTDHALRLLRFNTQAGALFGFTNADVGRNLAAIAAPGGLEAFFDRVYGAVAERIASETQIDIGKQHFLLRISPYEALPSHQPGAIIALVDQTAIIRADRKLRAERERLASILANAPVIVALKDLTGRYEYVNPSFERFFGKRSAELLGRTVTEVFPPGLATPLRRHEVEALHDGRLVESEDRLVVAEEERFLLSARFPLLSSEGEPRGLCLIAREITSLKNNERDLRLAATVFEAASEGILIASPEWRILAVNAAFCRLFGHSRETIVGAPIDRLRSDVHEPVFHEHIAEELRTHGLWQGEQWHRRADDSVLPFWTSLRSIRDPEGKTVRHVGLFTDLSDIHASRRRLEFLATHDELTGMPNRALFLDRLRMATAKAERRSNALVVMFVDLDNFKLINDTLGHEAGDQLLKAVADGFRKVTRSIDTVARLGGDEFGVILEDASHADAITAVKRIQTILKIPLNIAGQELSVSSSIGISIFPDDSADPQTLIANADSAMYRAKALGKNNYHFYTAEMRAAALGRLETETGLRRAIERDELFLLYQPKVDLQSGAWIGLEALVRWQLPERVAGPDEFVPIAEASRLIEELGEWVIRRAVRQVAQWQEQGVEPPRLMINLSPSHLRNPGLPGFLRRQMREFQVAHRRLGIEITESVLLDESDAARSVLADLHHIGILISVDDFGTGYSSLSYLKRYPIAGELKIDRSFVTDLPTGTDDAAICKAIVAVAEALGLAVIAEGVENTAQAELLLSIGCRAAQGLLFAAPMAAGEVARRLAEMRGRASEPQD